MSQPKVMDSPPLPSFVIPVAGVVTSRFGVRRGWSRWHQGMDFGVPTGTPILATRAGKVKRALHRKRGYGTFIEIDHGNGLTSIYAHLNKIWVKKGQYVTQGSIIGTVGETGNATNPHLHFEIRRWGSPLNPAHYL